MKTRSSLLAHAAKAAMRGARRSTFVFFAVSFLAVLISTNPARLHAQVVDGSIVGTVTDPTGAVIPNATVTVTDVSKGISQAVTSNAAGDYDVTRLNPDTYTVKATSPNFTPAEIDNVAVIASRVQQVNLTLNPAAAATTTVTVSGAPPPLQTQQSEVSQVMNSQQVQSLPNIDRNLSQDTLLTQGVQRASFSIAPTENPQGATAVETNGSNYGTLGWLLDGTDNREPVLGIVVVNPTLDSISEFQTITANYPAEYGGAVGGFVVAQTKSGGNQFHGDAFEFRRSGEFEARDPFTQYPGVPFPGQLYNQFGGSVGGPIRKDKTFFFLDYQGTRQRVGSTLQESVPTALVRSTCLSGGVCDLSQYASSITNPGTGATYSANAVPASALTSQGIALMSALPAPNSGGPSTTTNNYVASGNGTDNGDQADVRLDQQWNENLHSFARYDFSNYRLFGTPVFGAAGGDGFGVGKTSGNDQSQDQSASLGFDWALNNKMVTDFRFGFLDYHVAESKFDTGSTPAANIGIPNLNTAEPGASGSPTYNVEDASVANFGDQGCNCPLLESEQVFQLANNWTRFVGNHNIRFGADIRYAMNLRNASDYNRAGELSFGNGATGSGLASVLLGYVDTFQRFDVYSPDAANRQKRGAFYAEDSWRVRQNLTLNYGVRWDIVFPETVNSTAQGGFTDLSTGFVRVAGVGGIGTNGNAGVDLSDFGGRLGFALQLRNNTVLRGAVAQMYDDEGFFGTIFGSALTHNIPVYNDEDVTAGNATGTYSYTYGTLPPELPPPYIPPNGLIPLPNGINAEFRPNTLILPRVDQYNVSLQQSITPNMTFTLAYVGNLAERIYPGETYGFNVNVPTLPTTPAELADRDARRPYYQRFSNAYDGTTVVCCSQDITSAAPAARANYNAFQGTLEQRFSNGVQFSAHYTWSRALNYGTTYFAQDAGVEYGASDTNRNQLFVLDGLWELPIGKGKMIDTQGRFLNAVASGWQLSGTTTWESGLPFTPTYAECGSDQDIDSNFGSPGTSSDCRPDLGTGALPLHVGSLDPATHARTYFTPVAPLTANGVASGPFIRPAFGTIGNIGRNSFRGPRDYFADAALFKTFNINERVKAQFQFQAFNLFNHVPLGVPSASDARCIDCSAGSTDAGLITGVDPAVSGSGLPYMRTLQFGARFQF